MIPPRPAAEGLLSLLALPFLLFALLAISSTARTIAGFPYQLDREEGFLLVQASRLANGQGIYTPIETEPHLVGNYTPLYPAVFAMGVWLFGESLAPGRWLAFAAGLGVAALAGFVGWRFGRSVPAAVLAFGLFWCTYDVNDWARFARVDLPAIALGFAGVAVAGWGRPRRWIPAAAVLFTLAFLTKQTQILAPAAVLAGLLASGRFRLAGAFAALTAGLALGAVLLLTLLTGGQFWLHTVVYNANLHDGGQLRLLLGHLVKFALPALLALVPATAVVVWAAARPDDDGDDARTERRFLAVTLAVWLALSAASLASLGKAGAAVNYFLELHAVAAAVLAAALGWLATRVETGRWWIAVAAGVLLALLAWQAARSFTLPHRAIIFRPPPTAADRALADLSFLRVTDAPGPVLTDDPVLNLLAGKEVHYQPFIMAQLAREGHWDPRPLVDDLAAARFSLIVTERSLEEEYFFGYTRGMRDAALGAYQRDEVIPFGAGQRRFLYVPRSREE